MKREKTEKKETIFDHNVTPDELEMLCGSRSVNKEYVIREISQMQWYALIYCLYNIRGDEKTASSYAAKIPDTADKIFGLLNHDYYR